MTTQPTPWWDELRLRDELVEASGTVSDIQMSLRGVAYGSAGNYPLYHSVDYFGEITHPSPSMLRIAADIAVRLGGSGGQAASAKPAWRFDQGMGGGQVARPCCPLAHGDGPGWFRRHRHRSPRHGRSQQAGRQRHRSTPGSATRSWWLCPATR